MREGAVTKPLFITKAKASESVSGAFCIYVIDLANSAADGF